MKIIMAVLLVIVFPIALCLVVWKNKKRQKTCINNPYDVLKISKKALVGFAIFYIIGLLVVFAEISLDFFEEDGYSIFDTISASTIFLSIFTFSAFFALIYSKHSYFIIGIDRIIKKDPFKKDSIFSFNDISYYEVTNKSGLKVVAYDKNGIPMFTVNPLYANVNIIIGALNNHNIETVPSNFPTDDMKHDDK